MSSRPSTILIVDDKHIVRLTLKAQLAPEGYELAFASNGLEALEQAKALNPDLILLDVMMPGMDGFEVCQRLRADPELAEVPVIMVTALDDNASRLKGLEAGADDFITKPVDLTLIRARVRTITRLNRYRRLLEERKNLQRAHAELERVNEVLEADIAKREQVERKLAARIGQLTLLNKIGNKIAAVLDLEDLLDEAVQLIQESFGYNQVTIYRADHRKMELSMIAVATDYPIPDPFEHRLKHGQGLVGSVGAGGETLLANEVSREPLYVEMLENLPTRSELSVPIRTGAALFGVLDIQDGRPAAFDENDILVFETLAGQIAVASRNAELYAEERMAQERLRSLAGYLESAREKERTRIARDIHDDFGQTMTALKMNISWLAKRLPATRPELLEKAGEMKALIGSTIHTIRRIASDLRPGILDQLGLAPAIEWLAQDVTNRAGLDCELELDEDETLLDSNLATTVFRIFQETLTNVIRHAEATLVKVSLEIGDDQVRLTVQDNGKGLSQIHIAASKSLGLMGMQERASAWGGSLSFESSPGKGTTVTFQAPNRRREEENR